ncbi:phosphorylase superfamily domain-containing protein [Pochonia chlamydosporia 170]|uniref:Phosphorylase superfamily domain-containing protein n=1 Tax=Pochonia chlamydosporia 170 TaxID=1380566 RepID=A0A179F6M4_METCM|nr:phosphorylase superfamily domain-containing protein [Pochonia chlamydosporia 170]OAQ61104.2 phosphorylase superfamily domain-containing protein [Pochonia chlamydosporia 170]
MPGAGNLNSANTAATLRLGFVGIRLALVVGVCAGAPYTPEKNPKEVILGDVIISTGVVQTDFGREYSDQIIIKDTLEDNLERLNVETRSFLQKLSGIRPGILTSCGYSSKKGTKPMATLAQNRTLYTNQSTGINIMRPSNLMSA